MASWFVVTTSVVTEAETAKAITTNRGETQYLTSTVLRFCADSKMASQTTAQR